MPVSELIDYFNDRFRQSAIQFLPDEPLRLKGEHVSGRFGQLRLESLFQPVVCGQPARVVSHAATTRVRDADGATYPLATVFNTNDQPQAWVHLDRLCRMVHMLNYLINSETYGTLLLPVDRRHVLSVRSDHGRYFEQVLHRCGLSPRQIVICLMHPIADSEETPRIVAALRNYRQYGYQIALTVDVDTTASSGVEQALALSPDVLRFAGTAPRLMRGLSAVLRRARHFGPSRAVWLRNGVSTREDAHAAYAAGFDLLQGDYIGRASPDVSWSATPTAQEDVLAGSGGRKSAQRSHFAC